MNRVEIDFKGLVSIPLTSEESFDIDNEYFQEAIEYKILELLEEKREHIKVHSIKVKITKRSSDYES